VFSQTSRKQAYTRSLAETRAQRASLAAASADHAFRKLQIYLENALESVS